MKRHQKRQIEAVLCWVNEVRADDGRPPLKRLPRGLPCKATDCVLGRALEGLVDTHKAYLPDAFAPDRREVVLPGFINEFRLEFDGGFYAFLVGDPEPLELLEGTTDCFVPADLTSGERAHSETRHVPSTDTGTWGAGQDAPRSPGVRA